MIDNGIKMGEPIIDEVTDEALGKIIDNMGVIIDSKEKAEEVTGISPLTAETMLEEITKPKYEVQYPASAQSYQKMTPEQKKLHFPVNRAMRRKQGIR